MLPIADQGGSHETDLPDAGSRLSSFRSQRRRPAHRAGPRNRCAPSCPSLPAAPPTLSRASCSSSSRSSSGRPSSWKTAPAPAAPSAAAFVAKSEPDGYTILVSGSAHTIAPALYPKLTYHPGRDFAAVVPLGISPNVLVVSPAKGFKTVGDLVAAAKGRPGTFNFSSVGVGSATHLSAERFRSSAGINAVHVPFKGGAEAMSEVIAGRVDFFFGPPALVLPHVREGKLTALVVNGTSRTPALPDVPTTQEAGFKDAEYPIWYGLFVPAKTPRDIVDRLHSETVKALQAPEGAGADCCAFRRSHGHDAERLRRVCPKGNRPQRSAGQSGRHQAGLRSGGVCCILQDRRAWP